MDTLVFVILVLLIIGLLPTWSYSRSWGYGYYPSGILTFILIIILLAAVL